MPEGDTIRKLANALGPVLTGRLVITGHARTTQQVDLAGTRLGRVYPQGKHLFIELDADRLLRSHLGMWGSWHGYAPGEVWRKPRRQASIVLDTGERLYVCFNALQVEILRRSGVRRQILDTVLGPDLLADPLDYAQIIQRARALCAAATPLMDLLLNQRIACGIGNVYKSEVLFVTGWHPKTPLGQLTDEQLLAIYRQASQLLSQNTGRGPRITRWANDDAGRLWVYGRRGQPCLRCEAVIRSAKLGKGMRTTYWCPSCQKIKLGSVLAL
jgi:endonuclease-8